MNASSGSSTQGISSDEGESGQAAKGGLVKDGQNVVEECDFADVDHKEYMQEVPDPLDDDAYGHGIACVIRDMERLVSGSEFSRVRILRFVLSVGIVVAVITLQIFLLRQVSTFICDPAVRESRDMYDAYEMHMYGCNSSEPWSDNCQERTFETVNGKHRGKRKYFEKDRFGTLPSHLQKTACSISLSQPVYFGTILLIWTFTCIVELQKAWRQALRLVYYTPTIDSMKKSVGTRYGEFTTDDNQLIIIGITRPLKGFISLVFMIRVVLTCVLLWLGCRWLAATPSFSDILLNAVALEFIMLLKELIYFSLVPARSRVETQNTLVLPIGRKAGFSYVMITKGCMWGLVAIAWVLFYIYYFQQVLPQYNWDVHAVCEEWLFNKTNLPHKPHNAGYAANRGGGMHAGHHGGKR